MLELLGGSVATGRLWISVGRVGSSGGRATPPERFPAGSGGLLPSLGVGIGIITFWLVRRRGALPQSVGNGGDECPDCQNDPNVRFSHCSALTLSL